MRYSVLPYSSILSSLSNSYFLRVIFSFLWVQKSPRVRAIVLIIVILTHLLMHLRHYSPHYLAECQVIFATLGN